MTGQSCLKELAREVFREHISRISGINLTFVVRSEKKGKIGGNWD